MTPIASPLQQVQSVNQMRLSNELTPIDIAAAKRDFDKANQLAPLDISNAQIANKTNVLNYQQASDLAPYTLARAKQTADQETRDYQNNNLAGVAERALAAPDDNAAAAAWDAGMQAEVDKGNPAAKQYIGGYHKDLATTVSKLGTKGSVASAQGGGTSSGAEPPQQSDVEAQARAIASTKPVDLQKSLDIWDQVFSGFERVKAAPTPENLRDEIGKLKQAQIDVAKLLPGYDFSKSDRPTFAANFAAVKGLLERNAWRRNMIADRIAALNTGLPQGAPPPLYKPSAPVYLGPAQNGGRPQIMREGPNGNVEFSSGPVAIGPKTGAGVATYNAKLDVGRRIYPGDEKKAALYAIGRLPPDSTRTMEVASQDAAKELYDYGPGFEPPGGPEAWQRNRTQELYQQYMTAGQTPSAPAQAPGGPVLAAPPPVNQRVKNQVYPSPKGPMRWTGTGWVAAQ
jgi:hypothetical protein